MIVAWVALALIIPWNLVMLVVLIRGWPYIRAQREAARAVRAAREAQKPPGA